MSQERFYPLLLVFERRECNVLDLCYNTLAVHLETFKDLLQILLLTVLASLLKELTNFFWEILKSE
ncbi:hypothetical protein E2562_012625 [Oryza meyeriana var. granulata]|uniref:Uncharacterized protein n=1 Tax=Oryza meyeriana var. granulata TaxID=110450 RepID=A0A6G1CEK6_9ORYZ|nr:hypothetical protein E2562_012625 [Oryza meyeriana var. granulata]